MVYSVLFIRFNRVIQSVYPASQSPSPCRLRSFILNLISTPNRCNSQLTSMKSPFVPNLVHPQIARHHHRHHHQIDFSVSRFSLNGSETADWCFPSLCYGSSSTPPSDRPLPRPSPLYLAVMDVITIVETSTDRPSRKPPWYSYYWAIPSSLGLVSNKFVAVFLLLLLCCFAWVFCSLFEFKFVLYMFAKMLLRDLFHRYCITSKRLMVVIAELIILTITQVSS
jgi:hypothetical protein